MRVHKFWVRSLIIRSQEEVWLSNSVQSNDSALQTTTIALMGYRSLWARARGSFLGDTTVRLLGFATWIPVAIWFNESVVTVTKISGGSMYPYFNEDRHRTLTKDLVLNWRWNASDGLRKGMVVTFRCVPQRLTRLVLVCFRLLTSRHRSSGAPLIRRPSRSRESLRWRGSM